MEDEHSLKDAVIKEIENLPEDQLREILDFVGYLQSKKFKQPDARKTRESLSQEDPLEQYIGGVSQGTLAQDIDKELYNQ